MATTKMASVNDDAAVIAARKKLTELEQKLEQITNRPSQAIEDDIRERAELLLSGKPAKPKKEAADEIQVLKRAVGIALENYQEAQKKAAAKIIESLKPLHDKTISELLDAAEKFSAALLSQAAFVENCWQAGLFDFLDAHWSLKWQILSPGKPGGCSRLDMLIENLKLAT
jgi:hypothetical protein